MTFAEGNQMITPHCHHRGADGKPCAKQLEPSPDVFAGQCRTPACNGAVRYTCRRGRGHDGQCRRCFDAAQRDLVGSPGTRASTNVYDGSVMKVTHEILVIEAFKSRCPPKGAVHWKTTKRLASANLVAVIKTANLGAPLQVSDTIHWGEVVNAGAPWDEHLQRQGCRVTLNMLSVNSDVEPFDWARHRDSVAIIDCYGFVPEWIPVLKAIGHQMQAGLPFDNGRWLNIGKPVTVTPVNADLDYHRDLIEDAVDGSQLEPLIQICRVSKARDDLVDKLCRLVVATTLDPTQTISFVGALRNPVHLTQGPPGTGKSYLGVVLVRALMVIREAWLQINPSVGNRPILVLSYKNHAINEFLVDLVAAERLSLRELIRMGHANDPRLDAFSEKSRWSNTTSPEVDQCKAAVLLFRKMHETCRTWQTVAAELQASDKTANYQAAMQAADALWTVICHVATLRGWYPASADALIDASPSDPSNDPRSVLRCRILSDRTSRDKDLIATLAKGVQHYKDCVEPQDVLLLWLSGTDGKGQGAEKGEPVGSAEAPELPEVVGMTDNPDEMVMDDQAEEGENLRHLQEIYEVRSASACKEEEEVWDEDEDEDEAHAAVDVKASDPAQWTWDMSLDERLEVVDNLAVECIELLHTLMVDLRKDRAAALSSLRRAHARLKSQVYEGKVILGGTIVGCAARLESIRGLDPFAIVVEEASEVLEPLLMACLTQSTCKLEMIGDHFQLQPNIQSKYDFQLVNKVNKSLFERLIHVGTIPSDALSVQRRMRQNICDFTRGYYKDIVAIEDHSLCATKTFGQRDGSSQDVALIKDLTGGREVPGIVPHIFLWTHDGRESRAAVGISRANVLEAEMACGLVAYLNMCGVPRQSIVVLTPYKGQLLTIRRLLIQCGQINPSDPSVSCRLSTVDRFQGDEADIVIASLVVDNTSRTQFVQLVNRMIVLLSRARLAMYILANTSYFDNSNRQAAHWKQTFEIFQRPGVLDTHGLSEAPTFSEVAITFSKPEHLVVGRTVARAAPEGGAQDDGAEGSRNGNAANEDKSSASPVLAETEAAGLSLDASATKMREVPVSSHLPETVAAELEQKSSFLNAGAEPFKATRVLKCLFEKEATAGCPILHLLAALEYEKVHSLADAEQSLMRYIGLVRENKTPAHPWLLLALARVGSRARYSQKALLQAFADDFPVDAGVLLTTTELELLQEAEVGDEGDGSDGVDISRQLADPISDWAKLRENYSHVGPSPAMDALLAMVGLPKVKAAALSLCSWAAKRALMPPEAQQANLRALNFCFVGNPGTGKTTAAKHFAKVLQESGLRSSGTFKETTAQQLKDAGVAGFKKLVKEADGGVLFIDEAYNLDPAKNPQGGAVVDEILVVCEALRDRITVVLAGYEDSLNDKLFAYNDGLRSRFQFVKFDDFTDAELSKVWQAILKERHWREGHPKMTDVVMRRLAKQRGKRGFGNARAVRQKVEEATARATERDDFDPSLLILQMPDVLGPDPTLNQQLLAVCQRLQRQIGWERIKKAVDEFIQLAKTSYQRELSGEEPLPVMLNRLFLGNPGTGKTTCAGMYGEVLKHLGFLSKGDVVSKSAGDFGGSVVGAAQQNTLAILQSSVGKVLVIDEAYSLNDGQYGRQVLDTIVEKVQGGDDIAVLLLGYEQPMKQMLRDQNPGIARRFNEAYAFHFDDYNDRELFAILQLQLQDLKVGASHDFKEKALEILGTQRLRGNFGNAGAVKALLQAAFQKACKREAQQTGGKAKPPAARTELLACDLANEGAADADVLKPLEAMYQMDDLRSLLVSIRDTHRVAAREGCAPPALGHFVFTGAPGTGKTTAARVVAHVLHGLQLTQSMTLVEVSGLELTGEFVGQTKKKVEEKLKDAKGGVLFIDEAYELGKGSYGTEAVTALVAALTNSAFADVVVVIAGYKADIASMLETNAGLKSRFTNFVEFRDWEPADACKFLAKKAVKDGFIVDDDAWGTLDRTFAELVSYPGWANGRDVGHLWSRVLQVRAKRVVAAAEIPKKVSNTDVQAAAADLVAARRPPNYTPNPAVACGVDPLGYLNTLYGMHTVKNKLQTIRDAYTVACREGRKPSPLGHFVFTGSPGTGKTTVARCLGQILRNLDLVSTPVVTETSGLDLTAEYIGQTKKKVEETLAKAKGGVLFIDEAYELGKGHYSTEALTTLVAGLTNPEYKNVVVILAGYTDDMNSMMNVNSGLRSRFSHFIPFPDWGPNDSVAFFEQLCAKGKYQLFDGAPKVLKAAELAPTAEAHPGEAQPTDSIDGTSRDEGVTDAEWEELQASKLAEQRLAEQLKNSELELQRAADAAARAAAMAESNRLRELEKQRKAVQEALQRLRPCPVGFNWHKVNLGSVAGVSVLQVDPIFCERTGTPFGYLPRGMASLDPEKWFALDDPGREFAALNVRDHYKDLTAAQRGSGLAPQAREARNREDPSVPRPVTLGPSLTEGSVGNSSEK
ncbi:Protein cfxQ-like protein [Diplonema papillatum]|nr:Protein cfxQ-like protein [Diplonema papillatum]